LWIIYVDKFNGINEIRSKNPPVVKTTTESMDIDNDNNGDSNIQENEEKEDDDQDDIEMLFEIPPSSSDDDYGEFGDATTVTKQLNKSKRKARHYEGILNTLRVQCILAILHLGCVWLRLPILIADIHR
jgi:hypothetical protein